MRADPNLLELAKQLQALPNKCHLLVVLGDPESGLCATKFEIDKTRDPNGSFKYDAYEIGLNFARRFQKHSDLVRDIMSYFSDRPESILRIESVHPNPEANK